MNKFVLILGRPIDHLNAVDVHEDASSHGSRALFVVLGGAKYGEHPRRFRKRDSVGMSFVGANDVREIVVSKKIIDGFRTETHSASSSIILNGIRYK